MAGVAAAAIAIVTCHPGGAGQLGPVGDALIQAGHKVEFYASGPAIGKLGDRKVEPFSQDDRDTLNILSAKCFSVSMGVIVDVGDRFTAALAETLHDLGVRVFVWYDNPALDNIPGEYLPNALAAMRHADTVFFANKHLAIDPKLAKQIGEVKAVGVGFRPMDVVNDVITRRGPEGDRAALRADLGDKPVLVLLGGANDVYDNQTLPQFLASLDQAVLDQYTVVIQRHPRASGKDIQQIELWDQGRGAVRVSIFPSSTEALVAADFVVCGQTTMDTDAQLAGVPVVKIGDAKGILVQTGLSPLLEDGKEGALVGALSQARKRMQEEGPRQDVVHEALGMDAGWIAKVTAALKA